MFAVVCNGNVYCWYWFSETDANNWAEKNLSTPWEIMPLVYVSNGEV